MERRPAPDFQVQAHQLSAGEGIPNNPRLPLLVHRQALGGAARDAAGEVQRLFESHDWGGAWRNGVFGYHHYDSKAHEALGVCAGRARVQFGGPSGPVVEVQAGDVAFLPAGTGHKCVEATDDFLVVGAYPADHEGYDLLRENPEEQAAARERIAAVPLPKSDPVYGAEGPLLEHWKQD